MDPTIVLVPSASEEPAALRQTRVARNAMRQRQLVEKTQQLQKLTDELRTEIDAAEKDTLSADAIKKSEQIEKLAKSIRSLVVTPL
jgi:ribosomal protein S7